jgi:hypothetical protein
MAAEWDLVYGQGFYVSHVLGARFYAKAEMAGNQGTTIRAELYEPDSTSEQSIVKIKGVAKDNHGNVYKIVF